MVSYIHLPIVALCSFILLAIWRLWVCIDRLGFMREVSRRAPTMFHGHWACPNFCVNGSDFS